MNAPKLVVRAALLAIVLAIFASPSSAWVLGCYVSCPQSGNHFVSGPMDYSSCCTTEVPSWIFTCPEGGPAYGYGYEDWSGPNFC